MAVVESPRLDTLPTIIVGPGEYVTRGGRRVTVHAVSGNATFCAKGSIWRLFRGKERPKGFMTWHPSGRAYPLEESSEDVVGIFPAQISA